MPVRLAEFFGEFADSNAMRSFSVIVLEVSVELVSVCGFVFTDITFAGEFIGVLVAVGGVCTKGVVTILAVMFAAAVGFAASVFVEV